MTGSVSLPMYDCPAWAKAAFWSGLRTALVAAGFQPDRELSQPTDLMAHWRAPGLLISQTCGFPLTTSLAGQVTYLATPHYDCPGCEGPFYSSAVIAREAEAADLSAFRGQRVAYNSTDSQSGYNSLRALVAPLALDGRFFGRTIESGSHRASVAAVRSGAADIAAIDAVTWALLRRDHPDETASLVPIITTAKTPGLPWITAGLRRPDEVARLRRALQAACADASLAEARSAMLLSGVSVLTLHAYEVIPGMERDAVGVGYPVLA